MTAAAKPDRPGATAFVPAGADPDALAGALPGCRGCELWGPATQAVPGEGPSRARLVLVGEQPGDQEDRAGRPFVGPAGQLLDRALVEAGIDRAEAFTTNAVKHFRFTVSGKRRIHATPEAAHVAACRPWLDAELETVRPEVVVLLGATAAKAVYGPSFRITRQRGEVMPWPSLMADPPVALATAHPSAVLRAPDDAREQAYQALVTDLRIAAAALG